MASDELRIPRSSETQNAQAPIAKDLSAFQTTVKVPALPSISQEAAHSGITATALVRLSKYNVILLIDKSGSMDTHDCYAASAGKGRRFLAKSLNFMPSLLTLPADLAEASRWSWCQEQVMSLSRITSQIFPQGITVVLFSSGFWVYNHVLLSSVPEIFQHNFPGGGTLATPPLQTLLDGYFQHRMSLPGSTRPLLIAIITDGLPNDFQEFKHVIIDDTNHMVRPDEIAITILQVGNSWAGVWQMEELANKLVQEGAKYPIVTTRTFSELLDTGLTKALIDAITRPAPVNPSTH